MQDESDDNPRDEIDDGVIQEGQGLIEPLEEDNDTPFSDPDDLAADATLDPELQTELGQLDPTHQATDSASDIDTQQRYDEGLASAAEASEPNSESAVVDYNPENDQRKKTD